MSNIKLVLFRISTGDHNPTFFVVPGKVTSLRVTNTVQQEVLEAFFDYSG